MIEYTHLTETLTRIGAEVRSKYKEKLKAGGSYATGKLYNSVNYKITVTETSIKLLFVAEDYWINIEEGRAAGKKMPPISVIRKWMIAKGIPDKNGAPYLISRSISKKGIRPKPYLKQIKDTLPNYTKEIKAALEADIKEQLKNITNGNKLK